MKDTYTLVFALYLLQQIVPILWLAEAYQFMHIWQIFYTSLQPDQVYQIYVLQNKQHCLCSAQLHLPIKIASALAETLCCCPQKAPVTIVPAKHRLSVVIFIIMITRSFPAHDELSTSGRSLVFPKQSQ